MPLSQSRLKDSFIAVFQDYDNIDPADRDAVREQFADDIAKAIIDEIKLATITVTGVATGASVANGTIT